MKIPESLEPPAGADVGALVAGGYNLMIRQRAEGLWVVTRTRHNVRLRGPALKATGATLEEALHNLAAQIPREISR